MCVCVCVLCPIQVDRNLQDAMQVLRNVMVDPYLVPGGGATEMALSHVRVAQAIEKKNGWH